jgi:hypothetical protein
VKDREPPRTEVTIGGLPAEFYSEYEAQQKRLRERWVHGLAGLGMLIYYGVLIVWAICR